MHALCERFSTKLAGQTCENSMLLIALTEPAFSIPPRILNMPTPSWTWRIAAVSFRGLRCPSLAICDALDRIRAEIGDSFWTKRPAMSAR